MKLVVVGGGSTYTPELADGFARLRDVLPLEELVLVDPASERAELVAGVVRRMLARHGHPARVVVTDSVEKGAEGADAVLLQLRVGGQAARLGDETFPLECGCVGQETVGAGGLAKALRTVPVVLSVAERVRAVAPDAWIIDFTNPVGIVTRALLDEGHRAVGLCNVAIGYQRRIAELLGVPADQVSLDHVGLNHLTWERGVRVRSGALAGRDLLPELLASHGAELASGLGVPLDLMVRYGAVPSYYLRYYWGHDAVVAEQRAAGAVSRASAVAEVEAQLLTAYGDPTLDTKPELLSQRGGAFYSEAAVELLAALLGSAADAPPLVADVRNNGTFAGLPDEAVIEVPCRVTVDGPVPVALEPLGPLHAGLVAHTAAYEELALDAALRGGRDRVFDALLAHPTIGQVGLADSLADRLIAAGKEHLAWAR
ncbi:6-phospho-beta-glucosidase [Yinghuangia seranimata]|uniref:family 4 glycosyl hydrolase n=1 Tax=Yinghuangia seranimata TaxID=408067 RepID=UPI00248BBA7E|nr:6-phospho-beta-glucosidase [Yinghuangia seranimata]MDI2129818.1 6-phospho-beta-glucosidase [Yinghuangia seranimata]